MSRSKVHGNFHISCHVFRCKVHGDFHVPCYLFRCKVDGNFHVPCHVFLCKVHGNFHVPCHKFPLYMEISMYLATSFIKEKKLQRLPQLPINLPIVFKICKINKISVVLCQEKAAYYIILTKNEHLGVLFTAFVAFLAENSSFKLILATRSW